MTKSSAITFLVLLFFMAGCNPGGETRTSFLTPTQAAPKTITATPLVVFPSETQQPTRTPTFTPDPTDTLIPTTKPTLASLPISNLTQKCLAIQPDLPQDFLSAGKVLLSDDTGLEHVRSSIVEISRQDPQPQHLPHAPLFSDHFWGSFVSPDRKLLAYKTVLFEAGELVDNRLVLVDSDGQTIAAMDWEDNWFRIEGWLDMEHLILGSTDFAWPGVYIVNPFTGESKELALSLPDIYIDLIEQEKRIVKWKFILEPSLTRIGYERYIPNPSSTWEGDWSFVLWDMQNNLELGILEDGSFARMDTPIWSPDSRQLAVIIQDKPDDNFERFELFIMDRSGNAQKWVDLNRYEDIGLGKLHWSPNGRFIAIGGNPFIVLDTVTRQVWDYCISAGFFASPIYWSPDSKQLLVSMASRETGSQPDVSIVIDLEQDLAAQLHPDPLMIPIGWLETP